MANTLADWEAGFWFILFTLGNTDQVSAQSLGHRTFDWASHLWQTLYTLLPQGATWVFNLLLENLLEGNVYEIIPSISLQ